MKVKMSEILEIQKYLIELNKCDIKDIEIIDDLNYMNDTNIPIDKATLEYFKFIGLDNKHFVLSTLSDYDEETFNQYVGC